MSAPEIVLHEDAPDGGLATMLVDLMRDNLADSPEKTEVFRKMKGVVTVQATDAEVITTLVFDRGRCVVHDGVPQRPDLWVATDSDSILGLSLINIRHGMPYYFDEPGKNTLKKLWNGEVKIGGMFRHLGLLTKLTIVLSVN